MSEDIKKGLLGIVVDETEVSKVMPEINSLTYRGYAAQDLCAKCKFEEVAYLILNGELPNKKQLKNFEKQERKERKLSKTLLEDIKKFPKKAHPMDVARTAVSIMGLEDKETKDNSPKANIRKIMRIFAKTPVALAAFYRSRKGKKIISPKNNLSFSENFFYMCFGKVPNKDIVKAFDVSLILYAEHSFNVSTFTARTITSSLSDIHGAITGAIASLKGPLHGGANEEVMHMMNKIKKPENALNWINKALDNKDVVMGLEDKETSDSTPAANMRKALRIFAKTPTALAAFYRVRKGKKIIKPKKDLSFSENFFYMCFGKVPKKEIVKAFDVSLILYAEHSFNVSTFTARTITSSLSDIHGAITGAIASLKGPLHGGANEEVMHMMKKIKKPNNALKWIN